MVFSCKTSRRDAAGTTAGTNVSNLSEPPRLSLGLHERQDVALAARALRGCVHVVVDPTRERGRQYRFCQSPDPSPLIMHVIHTAHDTLMQSH